MVWHEFASPLDCAPFLFFYLAPQNFDFTHELVATEQKLAKTEAHLIV